MAQTVTRPSRNHATARGAAEDRELGPHHHRLHAILADIVRRLAREQAAGSKTNTQ